MSCVYAAPLVAVALLGQALPDDAEVAISSGQAFGKQYTVTVTYGVIKKTPDWTDAEENPPVSARKATKLATFTKDLLAKGTNKPSWKLESLTLMEFEGKWIWLAAFTPADEDLIAELSVESDPQDDFHLLTFAVLMDGTVIKPRFQEVSE